MNGFGLINKGFGSGGFGTGADIPLTIISGTAVIAFPAMGLPEETCVVKTMAVADNSNIANITNVNLKTVCLIPIVSNDHNSLDDFQWDELSFNIENIIDNTSFDIRANAPNGSWGNYNIKYLIAI